MESALRKTAPEAAAQATPMMQQYLRFKSEFPDAILFYRIGDFYEMFYEDAVEASKILDLTLTSRNRNDENPVPLCGVPHHAADGYLARLVQSGRKVAVCDQVEDPKQAKGIVRREITRVLTPGTVTDAQSLEAARNNFLLCARSAANGFACALCDVSTGKLEFFTLPSAEKLGDEIARAQIRELLYPEAERDAAVWGKIGDGGDLYRHAVSDLYFDDDYAADSLKKQFGVMSTESLSIPPGEPVLGALGGLLGYLKELKIAADGLLSPPVPRRLEKHLFLDETTVSHLEIFRSQRDQKRHGTLVWHLDSCRTPMGSRKLAEILRAPLLEPAAIDERLDAVEELTRPDSSVREGLGEALKTVPDLERLANRFVLGQANARDAVALGSGLSRLLDVKKILANATSDLLRRAVPTLGDFTELANHVAATLVDEPPPGTRDGGLIRDGVDTELDELRLIERSGKEYILGIERRERERTGIGSLKIRYNNVFGYYIEITNAHKDKAPADYVRKQTLANAERYITDELKNYEAKVLGAAERIKAIEHGLFLKLGEAVAARAPEIKAAADAVSLVDALLSFAEVSRSFRYHRPKVVKESVLELRGARHPVLERLARGERFVPNDVRLDPADACELVITGPNMAGKSTLMRMTALVAILAQCGCFVPCDSAVVGACDRVFTRVGAHDHLQKGLSTFMVEMVETAKILREATPRSLILLDEIGRGTSTFDGLSIAWAVAEDLHDRLRARTLFATHYHELCDLAEKRKGIKNYHMAVKEWNGEVIFLRKLNAGGTNRSYGVTVAAMAGLPPAVVRRAKEVLKLLEIKDLSFQSDVERAPQNQLSLFESPDSAVVAKLRQIDPNAVTPLQALSLLAELKEMI